MKWKNDKKELDFSYFIENSLNAIFILDKSGRCIYVNKVVLELTGFLEEELLQMTIMDLVYNPPEQKIKSIFPELLEFGRVKTELYLSKKDGNRVCVIIEVLEISKNNYIGFCVDITNRKNIELELKQYQDHLEELVKERTLKILHQSEELRKANTTLNEQKKQLEELILQLRETQFRSVYSENLTSVGILTAGIAHEMNNPLNFINASIKALRNLFEESMEIMEEYNQINDDNLKQKLNKIEQMKKEADFSQMTYTTRELIHNIVLGVERTSEIVKGILLFPDLNETEKKKEDIHKTIDSTLLLLKNRYANEITISKNYGDIPKVNCYQGKINQVFLNILTNAIESIINSKNTKKEICINTSLATKQLTQFIRIDISDTGLGIPKEDIPYLFEPFFTKKEVGKGTGLGLFISLEIIKKHKGFIEIESHINKGSTFSVFIPLNGN